LAQTAKDSGYLGVEPVQFYRLRYGLTAPIVAVGILGQVIWATLAGLSHFLLSLPGLIRCVFPSQAVTTDAARPVGIVYFLVHLRKFGFSPLLLIMMDISVALA